MGSCFSLNFKKKEANQDHPTVSKWLASCDFSSVPDIDDFSIEVAEERSPNCVIYDSVLGGDTVGEDYDGYTTAVENLENDEDNESCDAVGELAPSSCEENQNSHDHYMLPDEESVYETSDEQGPNELGNLSETPKLQLAPSNGGASEDEDDVVDDLLEWKMNYDTRPIRPLPTPLRKNLVSPRTDLESLVDRKGRVRRSERVQLYLDEKRQSLQCL